MPKDPPAMPPTPEERWGYVTGRLAHIDEAVEDLRGGISTGAENGIRLLRAEVKTLGEKIETSADVQIKVNALVSMQAKTVEHWRGIDQIITTLKEQREWTARQIAAERRSKAERRRADRLREVRDARRERRMATLQPILLVVAGAVCTTGLNAMGALPKGVTGLIYGLIFVAVIVLLLWSGATRWGGRTRGGSMPHRRAGDVAGDEADAILDDDDDPERSSTT